MCFGLRTKYPLFLSGFNVASIFLDRLSKNSQISNFMKIRLEGGRVPYGRTDGQTDEANSSFSKNLAKRLTNARSRQDFCAASAFPIAYQNSCGVSDATHCRRKFLCSVDKQLPLSTSLAGTFLPISCSAASQRLPLLPAPPPRLLQYVWYIPNAVSSSDFRILRVDACTQRGLVFRLLAL